MPRESLWAPWAHMISYEPFEPLYATISAFSPNVPLKTVLSPMPLEIMVVFFSTPHPVFFKLRPDGWRYHLSAFWRLWGKKKSCAWRSPIFDKGSFYRVSYFKSRYFENGSDPRTNFATNRFVSLRAFLWWGKWPSTQHLGGVILQKSPKTRTVHAMEVIFRANCS